MHIVVSTSEQQMALIHEDVVVATYPVSTSKFGLGETTGSNRTPRGRHTITEKIGANAPSGTAFKGRIPTGDHWTPNWQTSEDLILSRILWLSGNEPHNSNSHERYIYIHGTNQEELIGTPASIGCIRMTNADVIELFDQVEVGTPVTIEA